MTNENQPPIQTPAPPEEPRDLLPIERSLLSATGKRIKVRQDGKESEIAIGDAIIQKQAQSALAGSTHAQGQILRGIFRAEQAARKKAKFDVAHGKDIRAYYRKELRNWVKAGKDPKLCVPHPDDIKIEEGVGWSVSGPVDQADLNQVLKQREERDLFYGQAKLEERLADRSNIDQKPQHPTDRPGTIALVTFHMIDRMLPERFKATFTDILALESKFARMTKRDLLKHMHEGWRSAGHRVPRGRQLPEFEVFLDLTDELAEQMKLTGIMSANKH
jgi:hypothetical protein